MNISSKIKKYQTYLRDLKLYTGIEALLEWDQETNMPEKSIISRSEQISEISKLSHQKSVNKSFGKLLQELDDSKASLDPVMKRSIEISKKNYDKSTKIPTSFVQEMSRIRSLSQAAWIDAKSKEDFSIFAPFLEKVINLNKRYANYINPSSSVYDVLLDDFEEGMTEKKLTKIFSDLRGSLVDLQKKIPAKTNRKSLSSNKFDKDITKKFLIEMTKKIGFDYQRGVIGEVHHPFETKLSDHDIRINVKYPQDDISFSITSAIHELGHGLYEQFIDPKYYSSDLSQGVSLGIHESQSRLLENMIGRSEPFWRYFLPVLKNYHPQLSKVGTEDVVNDLNLVESTFIRTEADEVTYNLHIILRFELELMLLSNELKVKDLPEIWNSKMKELLGITPSKLSEGCLQDVHWSMGAFGYFPTYALGNLNAGQLWNSFIQKYPTWDKKISSGDFSEYFSWFKNNIWQHGSFYKPAEVMINATGEDSNPKYFVEYLKNKYH